MRAWQGACNATSIPAGNSVEPGATYAAFRGRAARVEPMLKKRGLLQPD